METRVLFLLKWQAENLCFNVQKIGIVVSFERCIYYVSNFMVLMEDKTNRLPIFQVRCKDL